jgi:hypothetical protein
MRRLAVTAVAVTLSAACSPSDSGGASGKPAAQLQVDESANGKTVSASLGGTVVVVLHSTYWSMVPEASVLQPVGPPQVVATSCPVAGGGCGTMTATFNAAHVGVATLRAHRTTCGEALRCVGKASDWSVTVRVS